MWMPVTVTITWNFFKSHQSGHCKYPLQWPLLGISSKVTKVVNVNALYSDHYSDYHIDFFFFPLAGVGVGSWSSAGVGVGVAVGLGDGVGRFYGAGATSWLSGTTKLLSTKDYWSVSAGNTKKKSAGSKCCKNSFLRDSIPRKSIIPIYYSSPGKKWRIKKCTISGRKSCADWVSTLTLTVLISVL